MSGGDDRLRAEWLTEWMNTMQNTGDNWLGLVNDPG